MPRITINGEDDMARRCKLTIDGADMSMYCTSFELYVPDELDIMEVFK